MALPPKEMNTSCLRCGQDLQTEQKNCPSCGADRDVELAVSAELNPAIAALQKLLAIMGGVSIVLGVMMYEHLRSYDLSSGELLPLVLPSIIGGLIMLGLCAVARKAPLAVSIISFCVFVFSWGSQVIADPSTALAIGPGLGLRIFLTAILFIAVRSALKARRIRLDANLRFPDARVVNR